MSVRIVEDGQKKLQIFQLGLWMTILFDTMKGVMAIIKNDAYYNLTTLGDVNWNAPRPNAVATKKTSLTSRLPPRRITNYLAFFFESPPAIRVIPTIS